MRRLLLLLVTLLVPAGSAALAAPASAPLRLVFASDRDGVERLYSAPARGGAATRLAPVRLGSAAVAAGRTAVVSDGARERLYAVGADGRGLRLLGRGFWPALSPDGRRVAYADLDPGQLGLWTIGVDGRGRRRVVGGRATQPAWSPDGRRLAFLAGPSDALAVTRPGGVRVLARGPIAFSPPAWSPDGRLVAFLRRSDTGPDTLWTVRPDGGGARRLATGVDAFAWAPRGLRVVTAGAFALTLVDLAGGTRRIPLPGLQPFHPLWSPDGRTIAFEAQPGYAQPTQLWTVGADGRGLRRLTSRGTNRLAGWTTRAPAVPPAPSVPPSETAAGSLVTTRAPIGDLSADGRRVAFSVAATPVDCAHVAVWEPARAPTRMQLPRPCPPLSTVGGGVYDVELAGARAAWVSYAGGNRWEFVLTTASVRDHELAPLTFDARDAGNLLDYHLRGDGGLLVFDEGDRLFRIGGGTDVCSASTVFTSRMCLQLGGGAHAAPVAAVGSGRIAVVEPDGVTLLDFVGRFLRTLPLAGLDATQVRLDGTHLVLARGGAVESRSVEDGRLEATRPLLAGERLLDADGGVALLLAGRTLRLVRLAEGRTQTLTAPGAGVLAELEPSGLFYAYRAGDGGRLRFVPRSSLP